MSILPREIKPSKKAVIPKKFTKNAAAADISSVDIAGKAAAMELSAEKRGMPEEALFRPASSAVGKSSFKQRRSSPNDSSRGIRAKRAIGKPTPFFSAKTALTDKKIKVSSA